LIAEITGEAKWFQLAQSLAEKVLALPVSIPWYYNMASAALAFCAVGRGDVAGAQEQYAILKAVPGIKLHYANTDRVLGLLAHAMGLLDEAAAHFEDALTFCRRTGYRPEVALTSCDYADLLLAGAQSRPVGTSLPGDRQKAMIMLDESLAISSELRMRPLVERVLALRERAKSHPARAPAYPDGLTQREADVLRLITAGKSNSAIGEELVLSVRTVERHITNIYAKINARGRADATAYALSHGLAHPQ
jgi:DNA-binding CsgD family transcriptional regulator